MAVNISLGLNVYGADGSYQYPDSASNVTVTALNGKSVDKKVKLEPPLDVFHGGPVLALSVEGLRVAYSLGLSTSNRAALKRVWDYRYVYSDPSQSTSETYGSEVAYGKVEFGTKHNISIAFPIFSMQQDKTTFEFLGKGAFTTGTITYFQGTEAWNKEGNEKTISSSRFYGGSLGAEVRIINNKPVEGYLDICADSFTADNLKGIRYLVCFGVDYKIASIFK